MKHISIFVALTVFVSLGASLAFTQETPKPAPELKKLEQFVGKWTYEGDVKPGPMGPGGQFTSEENCEWFEGGFSLICRSTGKGPTGPSKSMGILSYDPNEEVYTYYGVENMSPPGQATGTVDGNTWTYHGEAEMEGKSMKFRYTIEIKSPTMHTFKAEYSVDGGAWMTMMEGTTRKAGTT